MRGDEVVGDFRVGVDGHSTARPSRHSSSLNPPDIRPHERSPSFDDRQSRSARAPRDTRYAAFACDSPSTAAIDRWSSSSW